MIAGGAFVGIVVAVAAMSVLGLKNGGSGATRLNASAAEYYGGWTSASSDFDRSAYPITLGQKVAACNETLTITERGVGALTHFPMSYSQHQRQEWAYGCLEYLRMTTPVPIQPWER